MIRLNRLTDYAVVIMCHIAMNNGKILTAKLVSKKTGISQFTSMKILKMLAKSNLILSSRGANGGYTLLKSPKNISILEIINTIEQTPVSLTVCNGNVKISDCSYGNDCIAKHGWSKVNNDLKNMLSSYKLTDFINLE